MEPQNTEIISINIDGRMSQLMQLKNIVSKYRPIVLAIQDMPAIEQSTIGQVIDTMEGNYEVALRDLGSERTYKRENIIIIDRERMEVKKIHEFERQGKIAAIGASLCWCNGARQCTMTILNVYIRPRAPHQQTKQWLEWALEVAKNNGGYSRAIIVGDFNATSVTWSPLGTTMNNRENSEKHYKRIKEVRGRTVTRHMAKMRMTCLNRIESGPTFNNGARKAVTDLAFVGSKILRTWSRIRLEHLSEEAWHKLVVIEAKKQEKICWKRYKRIRSERVQEAHFTRANLKLKELCTNWRQLPRDRACRRMDIITTILYKAIMEAQEEVTETYTRRTKRRGRAASGLKTKIRIQMTKLRKQERKLLKISQRIQREQKRQGQARNRREERRLAMKLRRKVAGLRERILNNAQVDTIYEMDNQTNEADLWKRVRLAESLTNRTKLWKGNRDIEIETGAIVTQEQIEELAEQKFPYQERCMKEYVAQTAKADSRQVRIMINSEEIAVAINAMRKKRYVTPEGIRMDVFYRAISFTRDTVETLIMMSFWNSYVPEKARITQGTLIPKKAAGQFRIVHVSSPMSALIEMVALRRLEYRLEISKLNSPYQFGFRAATGRHELMARILELCHKKHLTSGGKGDTMIFSLDIAGAFDNVDQDKLIQKMELEMERDPIRYWLAEFVTGRQISVRKGALKSRVREVCKGVPQGSALGPILWNYMIHDIDEKINEPNRIELLKYADDIMLVYNGDDKQEAQWALDRLARQLEDIGLEIRPEKCSMMCVKLGGKNYKQNKYTLYGTNIRITKTMNILGMPINDKLKLDKESMEQKCKLIGSIRKLCSYNRLGLARSHKDWQILTESYIKSRLIINSWPILLLDERAQKWADEEFIKALKVIYEWPNNISEKLIRLVTKNMKCGIVLERMATQKVTTNEMGPIYDYLITLSKGTEEKVWQESRKKINLVYGIQRRRKHSNPSKPLNIVEVSNIEHEMNRTGPTWIMMDRAKGSIMTEVLQDTVLQTRIGKHVGYPLSYFNSWALLWRLASEKLIYNRCVTLSEKNSMLKALENTNNKDWRVIELRERLFDNGWRINKVDAKTGLMLRGRMAETYKKAMIREANNERASEFENWLRIMEERPDETSAEGREVHMTERLIEPYLGDYSSMNNMRSKWEEMDKRMYDSFHTTVTRALSRKPESWQNLRPDWIDGTKMMALGGLLIDEEGRLQHQEQDMTQCELCNREGGEEDQTLEGGIKWHNISREIRRKNRLIHRIVECKELTLKRDLMLQKIEAERISDKEEVIETTLNDRRKSQILLRYIAECARYSRQRT